VEALRGLFFFLHEEALSLTAYLISSEAGFITGANGIVDGRIAQKMISV
jgi:hypothetical protein